MGILLSAGLEAQESPGLVLSGRAWSEARATGLWADGAALADIDPGYSGAAGLRLNLGNSDRTVIKLEAAAEAVLLYGLAAETQLAAREALRTGFVAATGLPPGIIGVLGENDPQALLSLSLKKLSLGYDAGFLSFTIGRQIVNFGRAALLSPADVFGRPLLSGVQTGREGMDLARVSVPLGALAGLDLVARPGRDPSRGDYSARLEGFLRAAEGAVGYMRRAGADESLLYAEAWADSGAALAALAGLSLFAEGTLSLPDAAPWAEARLRASAGARYAGGGPFSAALEYYFNGKSPSYGYADPAPEFDPQASFRDPHYLFLAATLSPNDFWSISATLLHSFAEGADSAGSAALSWSYAGYSNSTVGLAAGASWGGGRGLALSAGIRAELKF
jgi:hypothetical protein